MIKIIICFALFLFFSCSSKPNHNEPEIELQTESITKIVEKPINIGKNADSFKDIIIDTLEN